MVVSILATPNGLGKACNRQFVAEPSNRRIAEATKALIDNLLLEHLSLAAIVRVTDVAARWLQSSVNAKYANVARSVTSPQQKRALDFGVRRTMGVCRHEAAAIVALAGARSYNAYDCRRCDWQTRPSYSTRVMAVASRVLSATCGLFHGFLGGVCLGVPRQAPSSRRERDGRNQPLCAVQQYGYASAVVGWCARRCHSRRKKPTTSARSGLSSISTTP